MKKTPSDNTKSLFDAFADETRIQTAPLAVRMRPRNLSEYIGQQNAIGPGRWLRKAIENDMLSSLVFYGPPGVGKTTLARIIAAESKARFEEISAVTGGVADLRKVIEGAQERLGFSGERTILFVDEIHRFSKSQQDALLHAVEDRVVVLIGATTENPSFEVNSALNSRSRIVELTLLSDEDIKTLLQRALIDERGYGNKLNLTDDALAAIVTGAGGDARVALTTLELAAECVAEDESGMKTVDVDAVGEASFGRILSYDKNGDNHYDIISAFIKSMRGSDPDAAVYWMARMLQGGEDPKFIARRMLIFSSEDIGNADPRAISVAEAAFRSAEIIGMPECRINLAQAAIYLAMAPKSNSSIRAIDAAFEDVRNGPARSVPNHLRDRHRPGSEKYAKYKYPHSFDRGWVKQQYLPDGLEPGIFYNPGTRGWEAKRSEEFKQIKNPKESE